MAGEREQQLRAYVDYLRDMGVHDFYRRGEPMVVEAEAEAVLAVVQASESVSVVEPPRYCESCPAAG